MKVRKTGTGLAGDGYHEGSDGKYYYGNTQNGHLNLTLDEQAKLRRKNAAKKARSESSNPKSKTNGASSVAAGGAASAATGGGFLFEFLAAVVGAGAMAVIALIACIAAMAFSIVWIWVQLIGLATQCVQTYGWIPDTIMVVVPVIFSIAVFLFFVFLEIKTRKYYIWQLLLAYFVIGVPYSIVALGGLQALSAHLISAGALIAQCLNYAISLGIFPAIVLFIVHKLVVRVQS